MEEMTCRLMVRDRSASLAIVSAFTQQKRTSPTMCSNNCIGKLTAQIIGRYIHEG